MENRVCFSERMWVSCIVEFSPVLRCMRVKTNGLKEAYTYIILYIPSYNRGTEKYCNHAAHFNSM